MASRDDILRAVGGREPPLTELPLLSEAGIRYPDPRAQLAERVQFVGGRCHFVKDHAELQAALEELKEYATAKKVVSLVAGVGRPNVDPDTLDDPHQLEDVDFAIVGGHFAVAENGAVWVTDEGMKHRVLLFLVQHLALVIRADAIVDNMHQAYERLTFEGPSFGCFISGPSKTADIEQSLVIGAHGPRSLTVYCLTG